MQTLISWHPFPAETPPNSTEGITVLTDTGEIVKHVCYQTKKRGAFFSNNDGKVVAWAAPSDIHHGEFVSVEAGPSLLLSDIEKMLDENDAGWYPAVKVEEATASKRTIESPTFTIQRDTLRRVLSRIRESALSDIEQLGKGG